MKTKIQKLVAGAIVSFLLSAVADAATQTPHRQFAEHMETLLAEMTATEYQHKTEIDEEAGVLKCDCSGLIGHVLRHHFPEAYLHVDGETRPERVRPLAANYCETFIAAGKKVGEGFPWKQITKVEELRPGDILAWKKRKIVKGQSTGHVLMIASIPKRENSGLYRVRVIDSTRGLHANDTRTKEALGVGSGEMWLSADEEGELNGFQVSERSRLATKNTLSVGRIVNVVGVTKPARADDRDFINLETDAAQQLAKARGAKSRIIGKDGESFPVTRKVDQTRLNFVIEKGKVARVTRG